LANRKIQRRTKTRRGGLGRRTFTTVSVKKAHRFAGRKRIDDRLQESVRRYRYVFDSAGDAIYIHDMGRRFLEVNKVACERLGYSREELLQMTPKDIDAPEYAALVNGRVEEPRRVGHSVFEAAQVRRDGTIIPVELSSRIIEYNGKPAVLTIARDITERKRIEEALKRSEERLRAYIEGASDMIFAMDSSGKIAFANRAACEATGYNPEELLGRSPVELVVPESRNFVEITLRKLARGEYVGRTEVEVLAKDGRRIYLEVRGRLLPEKEQSLGIFFIARDVTKRRRMEEALRESEEWFRSLFDDSPISLWVEDFSEVKRHIDELIRSGVEDFAAYLDNHPELVAELAGKVKVLDVNKATLKIYEATSKEEFRGGLTRIFTEESFEAIKGQLIAMAEGKTRFECETVDQTLLGERKHINLRWSVPPGFEKTYSRVFVSIIDVTESKRMAEMLRKSEERYRALVENVSDAIFSVDVNGKLTYISPAIEQATGYRADDVIGQPFSQFIHPDDLPGLREKFQKTLAGQSEPYELRIVDKQGVVRYIRSSSRRVMQGDRVVGVTGVMTDISTRKQMEEDLRRYSTQLEQLVFERTKKLQEAQRLATIGETAAMVGHDLRNPLTGISGAAYLLRVKLGTCADRTCRELLELVEKNVDYSDKIISDLLDYSGEILLEFAPADPKSIMQEAIGSVKSPGNVQIVDLTLAEPEIMVDPGKIRRVFVNLMKNAIEAMPKGGTLTVSSRRTDGDVEFAFADTGVGMTKEVLDRIWTPLFTTKAKGMGFGLSICKRIVEAHGGSVSAQSSPGQGTTFNVKIPIKPRPATAEVKKT